MRRLAPHLAGERGFTLLEVLVTATMLVGVAGAVLTTLTEFGQTTRRNTQQNDAQQEARRALSEMARELRNLASPTNELPNAVEEAGAADLVFLTAGRHRPADSLNSRNTKRVRYCLDTAGAKVWRQEQTWTTAAPPAAPASVACPEPASEGGWGAGRAVALDVANGARGVFTYNSAQLTTITEIRATLHVDADPAAGPREVPHETAVFLRNQNRAPTAGFSAAASGSQILLNGSSSSDPEGRALDYYWYDNGGTVPVGEGIVFTYTPAEPGNHSITLKVADPAGLEHTAPAQDVCIVGGGVTC